MPNSTTTMTWALIFEWYVVWYGSSKTHGVNSLYYVQTNLSVERGVIRGSIH